jgi:hypothetical protein
MVITKGQLSSNGHRYIRRGLHSKHSLGMTKTAVEDSRSLAATRQLNYKVIIIVQCKSDSSLKTRYILTE